MVHEHTWARVVPLPVAQQEGALAGVQVVGQMVLRYLGGSLFGAGNRGPAHAFPNVHYLINHNPGTRPSTE